MEVKIIDRRSIETLIQGLEGFEKDKVIKDGLGMAARVFVNAGKRTLRDRMKNRNGVTGNLLKSFVPRVKRSKLGALAGFARPEGLHVHLVDRGTVLRQTKRHDTGVMPANRFWTDTKNTEAPAALQKVYEGIERSIERIKSRAR